MSRRGALQRPQRNLNSMEINNRKKFLAFINLYSDTDKSRIFRGVSSDKYKLIPSIGRIKSKHGGMITEEKEDLIFRYFKQRSKPFIHDTLDVMNLLAVGQHHGLPTRLLDWTFNPLAAMYFAVEKEIVQPEEKEKKINSSLIYVLNKKVKPEINKIYNNVRVRKLDFFIPNYNHPRIVNQNGLFTIHPYPWTELKDSKIEIITISLNFRKELRRLLNKLGVNQSTIYPGLDGTAKHIKWMQTNFF